MILKIKDALDTVSPDPELIARTQARMEAETQPKKQGRILSLPRRAAALAACLLLVIGLSAGVYAYRFAPVGSVYLDAAPSIELEVSRSGNVVGVHYYNAQAETLISEKSLRGEKAADAVALVLDAARSGGTLDESSDVISLAVYSKDSGSSTKALLAACASEIEQKYTSLTVYKTTVQSSLQTEAETDGISPGKLSLIKMIQTLDGSATVSQYRGTSVSGLVDRLVYLTSDANTCAPETQKAAVRSDIRPAAEKREAVMPAQRTQETPPDAPSEPAATAAPAPVYRPAAPAATQSVGDGSGSTAIPEQTQAAGTGETAGSQNASAGSETQPVQQSGGGTQQSVSGQAGQQNPGSQTQQPGVSGQAQQPIAQGGQTPSVPVPGSGDNTQAGSGQQTQAGGGTLSGPGSAPQGENVSGNQQQPSPSNGDEGR